MIYLVDHNAGDFSALAVGGSTSTTLQSALAWLYVEVPAEHPYQLYQFLDLDGMPGLEVVASSVTVIREPTLEPAESADD